MATTCHPARGGRGVSSRAQTRDPLRMCKRLRASRSAGVSPAGGAPSSAPERRRAAARRRRASRRDAGAPHRFVRWIGVAFHGSSGPPRAPREAPRGLTSERRRHILWKPVPLTVAKDRDTGWKPAPHESCATRELEARATRRRRPGARRPPESARPTPSRTRGASSPRRCRRRRTARRGRRRRRARARREPVRRCRRRESS